MHEDTKQRPWVPWRPTLGPKRSLWKLRNCQRDDKRCGHDSRQSWEVLRAAAGPGNIVRKRDYARKHKRLNLLLKPQSVIYETILQDIHGDQSFALFNGFMLEETSRKFESQRDCPAGTIGIYVLNRVFTNLWKTVLI